MEETEITDTETPKEIIEEVENTPNPQKKYKILALGDSYTIGQSVCETCRFPEQLKSKLENNIANSEISLDVIAQTGWTTTNLQTAINSNNPSNDFDLVTLLIGVNNQYQNKAFSIYEAEFPQLLSKAIALAKGKSSKVIVISIPDYAYTPFGQSSSNSGTISQQLDLYNNFAETYSKENNVTFINITDITRNGLSNPELVASDGLHPSQLAYSKFVERLLPLAIEKLD
ncbi:SGNH/GDSL hydrolase family protein [Mariniflexile fucanivorans]|uniref:SGNH/GDSL hydrolase family protein n=1 Tax=Mariniflexile fucanivorans TaxID=264023 RepID=UPI001FB35E4D|nr:SGNH/GDSL hydrolase family protein [Mariniflexile fucanivorans]